MGTITYPQKDKAWQLNPLLSERRKISFPPRAALLWSVAAALQTLLPHSSRFLLVWEGKSCMGGLWTEMRIIPFVLLLCTSLLPAGLSAVQSLTHPLSYRVSGSPFPRFFFCTFLSLTAQLQMKNVHPRSPSPNLSKQGGTPVSLYFLVLPCRDC